MTLQPMSTTSAEREAIPKTAELTFKKSFSHPRAGAAYRIQEKTVVRAWLRCWRRNNQHVPRRLYNYPFTLAQSLQGTNSYTSPATLNEGFPALAVPDISTGRPPPTTVTINSSPKNFICGYTESYNFSLQQELGWNVLAQVGYVGTLTIHQHTRYNINYGLPGGDKRANSCTRILASPRMKPSSSPLNTRTTTPCKRRLEKRMSNGLQFHAAYTWSRFMGTCCDDRGDGAPEIPIPQYSYLNYAMMPNDRTNVFQFSAVYHSIRKQHGNILTSGIAAAVAGGWQTNATNRGNGSVTRRCASSRTSPRPTA